MKIRLDENLSFRVANAVKAFLAERTGLRVDFVGDLHPPRTTDPSWIRQFVDDGGTAVVSGDAQIMQHWPDLIAYKESGLIAFFPPTNFSKLKGYGQAALILRYWPAIVEKIKTSERGDAWRLRWTWTPDVTCFQKLNDPRFRDETQPITQACKPIGIRHQFRPSEGNGQS